MLTREGWPLAMPLVAPRMAQGSTITPPPEQSSTPDFLIAFLGKNKRLFGRLCARLNSGAPDVAHARTGLWGLSPKRMYQIRNPDIKY